MSGPSGVINAALVGFGFAGRTFHAPLLQACPAIRLHTVVSSRKDEVAARCPQARVASADQAFADPAVDLVVIATPNDTHAPLAQAALQAGKTVVIDKPFALTVLEAETLVGVARRERRLLSVFHNRRWDSDFLAARTLVADGRLGRVTRFENCFNRFRPEVRDRWREGSGPGAGVWFDLGPHLIDQALQLFGAPQAVTCDLARQREGGVASDYAHATLRYDGLRVVLHADMLTAASDLRMALHGDRGSFIKEGLDAQEAQLISGIRPGEPGWGDDPRPGVLVDGTSGSRTVVQGEPGDYRAYYEAIAAAMRGEGSNPVPPEEALQVMRVIEAGVRSSEQRVEMLL